LYYVACTPLLVSIGYIRLVGHQSHPGWLDSYITQRVVVLKDQTNKSAHEGSAQLACEAAGSIRTVASLTREDDCCDLYSQSLEIPLQHSKTTAMWSGLLYSFSQSMAFFVIALVFWYGSILVSKQEYSTFQFFIGLMVRIGVLFSSMYSDPIYLTDHDFRCYPGWQCLHLRTRHVVCPGCGF
jgi:ATP-binding cassette subfamily B (MDR/TAP) protein 1